MSRLTELVRRVEQQNPALAKELASEIKSLTARRSFGLNFERHMPETFEFPRRKIRRGDKVRFRAPRGEPGEHTDTRTWLVAGIEGPAEARTAYLVASHAGANPEVAERAIEDLVVVAEFRDPIYPGLKSAGMVERGADKPFHTVINGENYHALEALLFAYEGKVDCIYIDPPYNTRDKDWKYNNDFVDSDDAYKHSKWLAMMERRLRLAKRLLNPSNSVLIATIDENEVHRLGLLLEQIFPGSTQQMVTIVINPSGASGEGFSRVEEYALFMYLGACEPMAWIDNMLTEGDKNSRVRGGLSWESFLRSGTEWYRASRENLCYPILIDPQTNRIIRAGEPFRDEDELSRPREMDGLPVAWPIRKDGRLGIWRREAAALTELVDKGYAYVSSYDKKRETWAIKYLLEGTIEAIECREIIVERSGDNGQVEAAEISLMGKTAKTVWNRPAHNAGKSGSDLLQAMLPGRSFPYPKSLYAVEDTLRFFVGKNPEALIVDFFAGSGTTTHSVMRLNRQDGGRRRSICITNNEVSAKEAEILRRSGLRSGDTEWEQLGVCEYITKPRIAAAVTGTTPEGDPIKGDYKFTDEFPMSQGFEENVEFFDLTYEDPERVRHDLAFAAIAPLLWMKAGSEGPRIEAPSDTFAITDTYAVLFNLDAAAAFTTAVADAERLRVAYIVTDDEQQYQIIADALPHAVQPVRLYEAYLRTFQASAGED